jgi:hypothetical protein
LIVVAVDYCPLVLSSSPSNVKGVDDINHLVASCPSEKALQIQKPLEAMRSLREKGIPGINPTEAVVTKIYTQQHWVTIQQCRMKSNNNKNNTIDFTKVYCKL